MSCRRGQSRRALPASGILDRRIQRAAQSLSFASGPVLAHICRFAQRVIPSAANRSSVPKTGPSGERSLSLPVAGMRYVGHVSRGPTVRNKVCLAAIGFADRSKVVPAKAKIESQLGSDLPVILEVGREVVFLIVGLVDVGGARLVGASRISNAIRDVRAAIGSAAAFGLCRSCCCSDSEYR